MGRTDFPISGILEISGNVASLESCANHVRHIERLSQATYSVTCHMAQKDSSAINSDKVEIAFI